MNKQFRASVISAIALMMSFASLTSYSQAQSPTSAPATAAESSKADFNGTWKLNPTKSEFSPAPLPSAQSEVITLTGDDLTILFTSESTDGKQKSTNIFKLGGPEAPAAKPEINETPLAVLNAKAEWKGSTIVITQHVTYQGGPGTMALTYSLSADGKTLTKAMSISLDVGQYDLKAVYDKV
ncbi:hypothetical protein [Granulicella sp. dw_53]|uniref:hypothetical protein n=1 Tax=Granulicella sp. dw_53 TaxID=2719792 RepID=UPI001BD59D40|nr:hypothetical protein [Granulicella sp. dw_53]